MAKNYFWTLNHNQSSTHSFERPYLEFSPKNTKVVEITCGQNFRHWEEIATINRCCIEYMYIYILSEMPTVVVLTFEVKVTLEADELATDSRVAWIRPLINCNTRADNDRQDMEESEFTSSLW